MANYLPFLIGAKSFGVIALIIFLAASIIIPIPVFATRGRAQLAWAGLSGFLLTVVAAALITLGFLIANGKIWS